MRFNIKDMRQYIGDAIPDSYPVYYNYLYVIGDYVYASDVQGTIRDLKRNEFPYYADEEPDLLTKQAYKFNISLYMQDRGK